MANKQLMFQTLLVCLWLAAIVVSATAQSGSNPGDLSAPATPGAAGGMALPKPLPSFQASGSNEILRHRDFTGRPCLSVLGYARPHVIDPNLYDHVISATNNCPQRIAINVCYYHTQDCIPMEIPGDATREGVLGMMPAEKGFRFEFRERFSGN
jgi:hypothetical protein